MSSVTETTTASTTPAATTTAASSAVYLQIEQNEAERSTGEYYLDCTRESTQNMVMVGLKDQLASTATWKDLDAVRCASFLDLPDLAIGSHDAPISFSGNQIVYRCPPGSVLVALFATAQNFANPKKFICAAVRAPHEVDSDACQRREIDDRAGMLSQLSEIDNFPFQCPQLPAASAIVELQYDRSESLQHWLSMECCLIKKQQTTSP